MVEAGGAFWQGAVNLQGLDGAFLRIRHGEDNGFGAVLLDLLYVAHRFPCEGFALDVGLLVDAGCRVPECALRGVLAPRKNVERESRGPAVKVDALLVLVADWALRAGGLHRTRTRVLRPYHDWP